MKTLLRLTLLLIAVAFINTQCDKNPADTGVDEGVEFSLDEEYAAVSVLGAEIDGLEELALTDSSEHAARMLLRAFLKLDRLLDKTHRILENHPNDDAIILYDLARDAQQRAQDAAAVPDAEQAFFLIKESRYFALEALKLVRGDIEEKKEEIIARLEAGITEVQALMYELSTALAATPNENAQRVYDRAAIHLQKAQEKLTAEELRRAGFHLREARRLAHLAERILNNVT